MERHKVRIAQNLPTCTSLFQVHTRKGNPASIRDLRSVSVDKAATVIIMQPESKGKDPRMETILSRAQVASAAMAVTSLAEASGSSGLRIVLQDAGGHEVSGRGPRGTS